MKKTTLILSTLALVVVAHVAPAQLINPGFETWSTNILVPTAMDPNSGNGTTGWWDYNFFNSSMVGSSPISVTRCTDTVRTGSYSVRLETKVYTPTSWNIYRTWGIPFIGHEYNDTLGILFNGNLNVTTQTYLPGIPCAQNLTQFKFYYQYRPNGNDTAECRVELLSAGTPVAGGVFKTNIATGSSGWQQAVINFTYVNALIPDTLYVLFSSSSLDVSPNAGSVLWIDDASIVLATGIEQELGDENKINIFPNPSNGNISINHPLTKSEPQTIEIYNTLGEKVYSTILTNPDGVLFTNQNEENVTFTIDISSQPSGMYFYKVIEKDKTISTGKISIQ